jgi:tetratricopeptide (TPR) repeat protein
MKCAAAQELISEHMDGALGPNRDAELRAHLESCRGCREMAGDFAAIVRGANDLVSLEPSPSVWPRVAAGVREALQGAPAPVREKKRWLGSFWSLAGLRYATAAAVVLVAVGGFLIWQKPWSTAGPSAESSIEFTLAKLQEAQSYYERAIQSLREALQSQEGGMDPRLAEAFNNNLTAMDETIRACRQIIRKDPDNLTARAYLLTAYREKVNVLEEMMGEERSAVRDMTETTL